MIERRQVARPDIRMIPAGYFSDPVGVRTVRDNSVQ